MRFRRDASSVIWPRGHHSDGDGCRGPTRNVGLRAHAGFDYVLAIVTALGGLAVGLIVGEWNSAIFLVGIGAAMAALTASTRFSTARSA